jgi:hypothetical protein
MGCGSILGDLFYLADSLLDSQQPLRNGRQGVQQLPPVARPSALSTQPGSESLLAQLYNMYGEGQIEEEVFTALKALAERGQLRPADLAVHRVRAQRHPPHIKNVEVANALRGVRSRLAQMERTRETSAGVLADLEVRLEGLNQRMISKEQAARQAIEQDEEAARQRLAEKAELESSYERLSSQAQALRDDLARLDDLQIQLEAKMAELEVLQARGELVESINHGKEK